MHPLLTNHLPAIRQVFQENSVKKAYAFGTVCTDAFGEDSDVDILIDFDENLDPITYGENYFKIVTAIETILGRTVDLVTARTLRNPYFIKVMNKTQTLIYE
ncbi:nucleotidyltransferase family protein [Runella zeae]|uniref:nucleotidyltransferase family protein n=1 Tax=Runella zeae TaxID=94255 RepID=UPI0004075593|nr:nucleotidyltransferase domain-containing protein [Runella zeae]